MDSYKLSIILTIISKDYLKKCIDSVINQKLDSIELICIYTELNDEISEILTHYSEEFDFIKVFFEEGMEFSEVKNFGIDKSSGRYIAFLNSNDFYINENSLRDLYDIANENDADMVSGNLKLIRNAKKLVPYSKLEVYDELGKISPEEYGIPFGIYKNIFKKEFIKDNGIGFANLSSGQNQVFLAEVLSKIDNVYTVPVDVYAHKECPKNCSDYIKHYKKVLGYLNDSSFKDVCQEYRYEFFNYLKKLPEENCDVALDTVKNVFKDDWYDLRGLEYLICKNSDIFNEERDINHPRISVLIPVYNASAFLDKSIGSLINQTFEDFEIVCVNDGSKDNSLDILKDYSSRDNRIKVIDQENGGCGAARNTAFRNAKGDYVYFFDPDDFVALDTLERFYENMIFNDSDFVVCRGNSFNDDGFINTRLFFNYRRYFKNINFNKFVFNYNDEKRIVLNDYFAPWSKLYKKEFLENNNMMFNVGLAFDDVPFHVKSMIKAKRISHVNRSLYHYRVDNADSVNSTPSNAKDIFKIIDIVRDLLESENIFEEFECNFVAFSIINITSLILRSNSEEFYFTARKYFQEMSEDCVKDLGGLYLKKYEVIVSHENYTEFKVDYLSLLLDNEKSKLDKRILSSNKQIRDLKEENEELKTENMNLTSKYNKLKKKYENSVKLNDEILNSTSWKITKPLRQIKNR